MVAMSVIESEVEQMRRFIGATSGEEQEFYKDKLSSLEFSRGVSYILITNNCL